MKFPFPPVHLFRSEEMEHVQMIIPSEAIHETVVELGRQGTVEFQDLNPGKSAFQRTYAGQVRKCEEMARRLRFFADQIHKAGLEAHRNPTPDEIFLANLSNTSLDELDNTLMNLEKETMEINDNATKLQKSYNELQELQLVLEKAGSFFDDARKDAGEHQRELELSGLPSRGPDDRSSLLGGDSAYGRDKAIRLGFIAGVIVQSKTTLFERILFRATRGNMYLKSTDIPGTVDDPETGEKVQKSVFIVFFAGERAKSKIVKICDAFSANKYPFPEDISKQSQMNGEVLTRLQELQTTISASESHRESTLQSIAAKLDTWAVHVQREKAVYYQMNMLNKDVTHQGLVAEAWVPKDAVGRVQDALNTANARCSAQFQTILQPKSTKRMPPTYFRTDKYTNTFQEIVNAYGVARYREANPGVFTIVTFPFLFAVMFGDIGHGLLMLLFGAWMIHRERQLMNVKNEIFEMAFAGRYIIFLMAVFSIYTGFMYNEFFSVPLTIFGRSNFDCNFEEKACSYPGDKPYSFGGDPLWHGTPQELPFYNSVKMKMSVIFGVFHMSLGIVMSLLNGLYYKDYLDIYYGFIPQIIFLWSIFGYLCLLIILKWNSQEYSNLYSIMIGMFLNPGIMPENSPNGLYPGQAGFQVFLLLAAFISVPFMLFPKPFILKARHENKSRRYSHVEQEDDDDIDDGHGHGGGKFDFGEYMVHQMIHTIEFVLGAVSNTASYLRLWALSLAHSQLSSVFYDRVLMASLSSGPIGIVFGFTMWCCATLGVLMGMESLSAFLHALRLHWVEYQNKFYHGDGHQFSPFDFRLLEDAI